MRPLRVIRDPVPGAASLDTAVSRVILDDVARGVAPETLRVWRPADALAFSVLDRVQLGFGAAVAAARAAGFPPFLRLAGGHAAVYTRETLAFSWTLHDPTSRDGIGARFEALSGWFAAGLRALGVDARVGAVAGEYCPGDYSVNAGGRVKLVGIGQRVVRNAAHVGGVVVVSGSERVRAVLAPVYAALGLEFDPASAGSVADVAGDAAATQVTDALLAELSRHFTIEPGSLDPSWIERARDLEERHRIDAAVAGETPGGAKWVRGGD
jgi:octanoyl-[GcvH]:protein N-octanoyltransferase